MTDAAQPQGSTLSLGDLRGFVMRGEIALALGVLGILAIMLVPLPPFLLDMLLAVSVGSSRVDLQACKLEYSIVSPK